MKRKWKTGEKMETNKNIETKCINNACMMVQWRHWTVEVVEVARSVETHDEIHKYFHGVVAAATAAAAAESTIFFVVFYL